MAFKELKNLSFGACRRVSVRIGWDVINGTQLCRHGCGLHTNGLDRLDSASLKGKLSDAAPNGLLLNECVMCVVSGA
eukprot:m.33341 g.33341  ORF g.33341 m.33341 type:complete len:77 (-) comp9607_c1_seq2:70-300(-)